MERLGRGPETSLARNERRVRQGNRNDARRLFGQVLAANPSNTDARDALKRLATARSNASWRSGSRCAKTSPAWTRGRARKIIDRVGGSNRSRKSATSGGA